MTRLIQRSYTTVKGLDPMVKQLIRTMKMQDRFTVSWNIMNLRQFSKMLRPHLTALKIDEKLSSKKRMSAASFATAQPEPMQNPTSASLRAMTSEMLSPVTATTDPESLRADVNKYLSYGVARYKT